MQFEMNLAFCALVVLTWSPQTGATFLSPTGSSASPDLTEDPGNNVPQWTRNPAGRDGTSTETTALTQTAATGESGTVTDAVLQTHLFTSSSAAPTSQQSSAPAAVTAPSASAAAHSLSSTPTVVSITSPQHTSPTDDRTLLTSGSLTTVSSQPAHTAPASSTQSGSLTRTTTQASAPGWVPAGPTHQEFPSELNVGDEDLKRSHYRSSSPLDPLLAGLLSVFIVITAIVFIILFLKFRQRTNHPEFHRLQDLPMDDLMEDTPLSRYTY